MSIDAGQQPSPPTSTPHRYILLLFAQSEDFTVPSGLPDFNASDTNRLRLNYTDFITEYGLGSLLEANYLRVGNYSTVSPGEASSAGVPWAIQARQLMF